MAAVVARNLDMLDEAGVTFAEDLKVAKTLPWRHVNVVSSLLFVVPGMLAGIYGDSAVAVGCTAVLTTSLWYHSFRTPTARWVDMATSGVCITYFMITRAAVTISYFGAVGCLAAVVVIWRVKSRYFDQSGALWHALVHALSSAGICLVVVVSCQ